MLGNLINNIKIINHQKMSKTSVHQNLNNDHIVWVDLEMSGLNIDKDHIIEMACLITDKDLKIVAEGPELVIKQSDECLDGMDDWCKKTHGVIKFNINKYKEITLYNFLLPFTSSNLYDSF